MGEYQTNLTKLIPGIHDSVQKSSMFYGSLCQNHPSKNKFPIIFNFFHSFFYVLFVRKFFFDLFFTKVSMHNFEVFLLHLMD